MANTEILEQEERDALFEGMSKDVDIVRTPDLRLHQIDESYRSPVIKAAAWEKRSTETVPPINEKPHFEDLDIYQLPHVSPTIPRKR